MTETIGLDDLSRTLIEHFAETDEKYRAYFATKIGANFTGDRDVMAGIDEVISAPCTAADIIVDLANEVLSATYTYEGDSVVTVQYPDNSSTLKT